MKGSFHNFSGPLHCVIPQILWFKNQKLSFAWFVYMRPTLSKWLSTLDLCTREEAVGSHFVSYETIECIVAYGETSETKWRRPWFCTPNASTNAGL